jgi:lactoylglutathione lyase
MDEMQLTHLRLLVSDFDACFRFYRDVMGFRALWGEEGSGYASFTAGSGAQLALFGRQAMADAIGAGHLPQDAVCQDRAMVTLEVEALEGTMAALQARGATFVTGIQDHPEWGMRAVYLRDPDGTLIEISSALPDDEWTEELRAEANRYRQPA